MKKSFIDISNTGFLPEIISDYFKGDEKLQPFYNYPPHISSVKNIIKDVQKTAYNRNLLAEVLLEQYSHLTDKKFPLAQIGLLRNENTFTVCTGHQLCLFTGPIYFIYKIISTIKLSEEFKKNYPAYNFVPVFWMAGEDHDFDEINHIHLFGKSVAWKNKQEGAAGNFSTEGLDALISEIQDITGSGENARSLLDLFSEAYLRNENLGRATRYLINELFGKYGLLVFDGNDPQLKNEFRKIISDDLFDNSNYKLVNETIAELSKLGYRHQVNPRPVNLFLLGKNERRRIEKKEIDGDPAFWKKLLEDSVERFSPNVVLRPLFQQFLLPNISYTGGPNELAYWFEYRKMFSHHGVIFPLLFLRNSVLLIDSYSAGLMEKLQVSCSDFFGSPDSVTRIFLSKNMENEITFQMEKDALGKLFQTIALKAEKTDPTIKPAVESELERTLKSLGNIEMKLLRAEKKKNEVTLNRIKKIREKLFPQNNLQERFENFIPYYLTYGRGFFDMLMENLDPLEKRLTVFTGEKE